MHCFIKIRIMLNVEILQSTYQTFITAHYITCNHIFLCVYYTTTESNNFLFTFQQKPLRLINSKEGNCHTVLLTPLSEIKMMKRPDNSRIENCLFISKYVNNKLPPTFNSCSTFSSASHNYENSFVTKCHL